MLTRNRIIRLGLLALLALGGLLISTVAMPRVEVKAQQATGSLPTVTGTPAGPFVTVYQDLGYINVYAGPSKYDYPDPIGIMLANQSAPALGWSIDKQWIMIQYPGVPNSIGWVYAVYVSLRGGQPPIVDSPPTPTPASTPTINPTLAAAFITQNAPTRLPTFTQPAPLVVPTFVDRVENPGGIPSGLIILGLGFVGSLGALISFLRGR